MKKQLFAALLCVVMLLTLISCGFQALRYIALCKLMKPFTPFFMPRNAVGR